MTSKWLLSPETTEWTSWASSTFCKDRRLSQSIFTLQIEMYRINSEAHHHVGYAHICSKASHIRFISFICQGRFTTTFAQLLNKSITDNFLETPNKVYHSPRDIRGVKAYCTIVILHAAFVRRHAYFIGTLNRSAKGIEKFRDYSRNGTDARKWFIMRPFLVSNSNRLCGVRAWIRYCYHIHKTVPVMHLNWCSRMCARMMHV